jgi:hypothetical protein
VLLEKFKVLMDAQDRQSHTAARTRKKRRTATIAPLVVLRVARSGTLLCNAPCGAHWGFPSPRLTSTG